MRKEIYLFSVRVNPLKDGKILFYYFSFLLRAFLLPFCAENKKKLCWGMRK
jgi:hypothetical protein